ncbi:hypothetical protein BV25DRAFT_1829624 [Artomyces pyxidatus]|uniref:Uncharacterized protein n=1 Tax=Artomyces pyxidatus TaxID=48021 RepID=A0ACB8SSE8_9AGAM|nr:hypothetical protein BV25DRAFT_1829624 [Artomyces pyxidatus]
MSPWFLRDPSPALTDLLALPTSTLDKPLTFQCTPGKLTTLGKLHQFPLEIIVAIFDQIDRLQGACSSCVANALLCTLGQRRLEELRSSARPQNRDLPPGLLTAKEFREAEAWAPEELGGESSLFSVASRAYDRGGFRFPDSSDLLHTFRAAVPRAELGKFEEMACIRPTYAEEKDWVLCNLSKKEYLTGLPANGPYVQGKTGLGAAVVSQIGWSSDASCGFKHDAHFHKGPWAGDRFKITTMDRFPDVESWKDASERVVSEIAQIWEGEHGDKWRSMLMHDP